MVGVCRDALPVEARTTEDAMLGGEAVSRRLAAILAADGGCDSRLMKADEAETLARLKSLRRDLVDLKIAFHKGRTAR
jgi:adenylate cyclase